MAAVDDFGRQLGCLLYWLIGIAVAALAGMTVLACLILAGVL